MDYTQIVEKALRKESYTEDIKDFTPEQKTELSGKISEAAQAAAQKELDKIEGLRKESKRIEDKNKEVPPLDKKEDTDTLATFAKEQKSSAESEFFSNPQNQVPPEKKAAFDETFKRLYNGEVSKDKILSVFRRSFAAVMEDDLLKDREENLRFKKNAAEFNSGGANAAGGGSSPDNKYSPEANELYISWQQKGYGSKYTLERADKIIKQGMTREL